MFGIAKQLLRFLVLLVQVPVDILLQRRHKTYRASARIRVPRAEVFDYLRGAVIELEGAMKITVRQRQAPEHGPNVIRADYEIAGQALVAHFRDHVVEPPSHMVSQMIPELSDREMLMGDNYTIATHLTGAGDDTVMEIVSSLDHTTLGSRFAMPMTIDGSARQIARACETAHGVPEVARENALVSAIGTGVITLASFGVLFGLEFAAILIFVLLLHELGHVIAMRWCGVAVRGIYFIPFMGAVAVGREGFHDEGRRGFIALLGPALSLAPTVLFVWAGLENPGPEGDRSVWWTLAAISIFLNLFNLFPFLPLDGGQIIGALLSRMSGDIRHVIQLIFLVVASGLAVYIQSYVLLAIFLVVGLSLVMQKPSASVALNPIGVAPMRWLSIAYIATVAAYVALGMKLFA